MREEMDVKTIKHFHLYCGSGGGAKGFNNGEARIGQMKASFECIGGVDVDPLAVNDFKKLSGVPATLLDLFSREQYIRFHGVEPPADWKEVTPEDIRKAAGNQNPNIIFTSAPCKGFSGLLAASKAKQDKYQALNELTVRGFFLCLEAFKDDLPEFFIMENVPRIQSRGKALLNIIEELLKSYGYVVAHTTHDCGEIGGLAQSRRRYLMLARNVNKVPAFLYEPTKRPLASVGDVLGRMPLPGCASAGPMHDIPSLQWKTWVRLAFVEAGSDWRSLQGLNVEDGTLKDFLIMPEKYGYSGTLGVSDWTKNAVSVTGRANPTTGAFSVADPRPSSKRWAGGKYRVTRYDHASNTVIAASTTGDGAFAIADPRTGLQRTKKDSYNTVKHYGVIPWDSFTGVVSGASRHDNGSWSVADPRPNYQQDINALPKENDRLIAVIEALDGTWHRPFTTLELAALQGLVSEDDQLLLSGNSHTSWRERIGNMVPPTAAKAIADVMGETLLLAWSGETFTLSSTPVWVKGVAVAASVNIPLLNQF